MDTFLSSDVGGQSLITPKSVSRPAQSAAVAVSTLELDENPHGVFRRLRPVTPLIKREDGSYLAIRAADVQQLITDPRTRQLETELVQARGINEGVLFDFVKNTMLFTNGPAHRKRRAPLSRVFAVKLIAELRPRIRAVAEELIDRAAARKEMDFFNDFCALIPARIISEILGMPEEDIPRFTRWVYSMARAVSFSYTREEIPEIEESTRQMAAYVNELLASRRASPREDFLSAYVKATEEEGNLSALEILVQIVTIILAGSDTTRAAMAIQTALLLKHREQWDALCRDASLIPGAVSEALRYEPSVGSVPRFTLEDIELGGCALPRHCWVSLSTMSAMRDPALYSDPETFNIKRTEQPVRHLVFGGGVHRCLGESLAKAELEEGLAAVAARLPGLQLAGDPPTVRGHSGIRRIDGMRVCWS